MMAGNSLTVEANSNLKLNGEHNQGVVQNNNNLRLLVYQSLVNLRGNNNGKFNVEATNLTASGTSNTNIIGKKNNLTLENSSNIKFEGNGNECRFVSNSNFKFSGDRTKGNFLQNSNTLIQGNDNDIEAGNNANLKITGDKNRISIFDTRNHQLKNVEGTANPYNTLTISPSGTQSSNWVSSLVNSWAGNGKQNLQYSLEYINQANIKNGSYNVGIFNFDVKPDSENNQLHIKINDANLDIGSVEIIQEGIKSVIVRGYKNGQMQELMIKGPQVKSQVGNNNKTLLVGLIAAAGI